MAKKKRKKEQIIFVVLEGNREKEFILYLSEVFDPNHNIKIKYHPDFGGCSDAILDRALRSCFYDRVYVWFDEDSKLSKDRINALKKCWNIKIPERCNDRDLQALNHKMRNPILIVSNPISIEGIIIKLFDKNIPNFAEPLLSTNNLEYNKRIIKNSVEGIMQNCCDIEYYRNNLSKNQILEKASEIKELEILLSIFNIKL